MISNKKKEELRAELYNKVSNFIYADIYYGCYPESIDTVETAIHEKVRKMIIDERKHVASAFYSIIDTLIESIYTHEEMEKDLGI